MLPTVGCRTTYRRHASWLDFPAVCAWLMSMIRLEKSGDYDPVVWVGRLPVYATMLLVGAHVLAMLAAAASIACDKTLWLLPFVFDSAAVTGGFQIWRWVTYAFVHVPDSPQYYLWFALEMFLLFVFGREIERFCGRRRFLTLYGLLLLVPPLVLTPCAFLFPSRYAGSGALHFAVFLAFATLLPSAEMLFNVSARWMAAVLFGAATLQAAVFHDWISLVVLWLSAATAVLFVRAQQHRFPGAALGLSARQGAAWFRRPAPGDTTGWHADDTFSGDSTTGETDEELECHNRDNDVLGSIDPLLDKIAREGLHSLTPAERERLEKARRQLLRKR